MNLFPSPFFSLRPPVSAILILSYTACYEPNSLPSFPVLDRLSTWTGVHSYQPPPPIPALAVLLTSTCSPVPSQTLYLRAACRFWRLFPCPFTPLSLLSTFLTPLLSPVGVPLFVLSILWYFLWLFSSPDVLDLQPGTLRSQWGSGINSLDSCPTPSLFLL